MKFFLFLILLACSAIGIAQTTYTIDYSYEQLNTSCNVFSSDQTIDKYVHQATKGFPNFVGNPDYYINLPCKRNSSSSQTGTDYQILFPFKKDHKYQVNVYYRGTITASNELYPSVALALNSTKKTHNTSTSCSGPQSISESDYMGFGASGSSFAWASNVLNTSSLTQDYEALSVASFPWPANSATGTQSIHIRKIEIIETPPPITITNNTISFATPYQYMEDIAVQGSTPSVSSGTYTYSWLYNDIEIPANSPLIANPLSTASAVSFGVSAYTLNSLQLPIMNNHMFLITGTVYLKRKITHSSGLVNISNALALTAPPSTEISFVDPVQNQFVGSYKAGTTVNFALANPVPGVKYIYYYYHRASSTPEKTLVQGPSVGSSFTVTIPTSGPAAPPQVAFADVVTVMGSDGTWANYHFHIIP